MADSIFGDVEAPQAAPVLPNAVSIIVQISPAQGWQAAFLSEDPHPGYELETLACFALVEMITQGAPLPERLVRPMVAGEDGNVFDVVEDNSFICLVPPHIADHKIGAYVEKAQKNALEAGEGDEGDE